MSNVKGCTLLCTSVVRFCPPFSTHYSLEAQNEKGITIGKGKLPMYLYSRSNCASSACSSPTSWRLSFEFSFSSSTAVRGPSSDALTVKSATSCRAHQGCVVSFSSGPEAVTLISNWLKDQVDKACLVRNVAGVASRTFHALRLEARIWLLRREESLSSARDVWCRTRPGVVDSMLSYY